MNKQNLDYYNQFLLKPNKTTVEQVFTQTEKVIYHPKKKSKYKKFINCIILFFTLSVLIFIANAFSNILAISTITIYNPNSIAINSYDVYLIQLNEFTDEKEAQKFSQEIKLKGGAGEIINDITYRVMASSYTSLSDASNVVEKLREEYKSICVYKLKVNRIKITNKNKANQLEKLSELLSIFKNSADTLNTISFKLDLSEISSVEAKKQLLNLYDEINSMAKNLDDSSLITDEKIIIMKAKIEQEIELIRKIIESNLSSNLLSAELKCQAIGSYLLQNELSILIA